MVKIATQEYDYIPFEFHMIPLKTYNFSHMKVLVSGANGLLGAHVVRELLANQYSVRAMVREGSNLKSLDGLNIEFFKGEITCRHDVEKAVCGCDFVIHAAARTSQTPSGLKAFLKPNIISTKYFIDACIKSGVKRFVFVSTANCFGNGTKALPGNEQNTFLPWLKNSGYAYSKFLAQRMVLDESGNGRLDAVVVNPTFILGAHDVKPSSGQIFSHILNKRLVFYPPGGKNFVDADEAAKGVANAMKYGRNGECYLLAGQNLSFREFYRLVEKTTGVKSVKIKLPGFVILVTGMAGSFIEKHFKKNVLLTKINARMICQGNYYQAGKAVAELNFEFKPAEIPVKKSILWFLKNNYFI